MIAIYPLVLLAISMVPVAAKAVQVDNPEFVAWSKCAIGSTATYLEMDVESGNNMSAKIGETLEEKADDHVVIQYEISLQGSPMSVGNRRTIPAKREKLRDEKTTALPDEQIQVGKQKINCKVARITGTLPDGRAGVSKVWTSDAVPGGVVKTQSTTKTDTGEDTSMLELKGFEKK